MGKQFKRKPTNKPIKIPDAVERANEKLKKRARHIEAADVGQPGKFIRLDLKKIYRLCVLGMDNKEMAEHFDIKYETWMAWLRPDSKHYKPELSATIKHGTEGIVAKVAERLVSRAIGHKHKAVKFFYNAQDDKIVRQEYIQHYPPSEAAAAFILKNKRPSSWKDKPVEDLNPEILTGATSVSVVTDPDKIKELLKRKQEINERKNKTDDGKSA